MSSLPLVSIMIATKDRHEDLEFTLRDLLRQEYDSLEMLVIDDGSTSPVEPLVRQFWPGASVVRYETGAGQNIRRNEGFRISEGKYILHLDDDCSPVTPDAIRRSVELMEANPGWAGLSYFTWNGMTLPVALDTSKVPRGNCMAYLGAAVLLRKAALNQTAGYREFFFSAGEEEELGMQLLDKGWRIAYRPELIFHHRYSSINRVKPIVWKWALRNRLWTILLHTPLLYIPVECGWKIVNGFYDGIRLGRLRMFFTALMETATGLPRVLRLRRPFDQLTQRRFGALRSHGVLPYELFDDPPREGWSGFVRWAKRWPNRLREGSRWSKQKNIGKQEVPSHEHELAE